VVGNLTGRPKCYYCHRPLYLSDGKCTNCGAPATPLDPLKPTEDPKVQDEIKHPLRRDTPAMFFK